MITNLYYYYFVLNVLRCTDYDYADTTMANCYVNNVTIIVLALYLYMNGCMCESFLRIKTRLGQKVIGRIQ